MPHPSPVRPRGSFDALLQKVHTLGKEVLAAWAADVDHDARFPHEALAALRQARLLSCYVPEEFGGMGLDVVQVGRLCEALGQHCGSTAMIFAMHQIQVACLVHHGLGSAFFCDYLRRLVEEQRLLASATTEVGVGGDLRSSLCALEVTGDTFRLVKKAPVISYGEAADDILITCRSSPSAAPGEQSHVLVHKGDYTAVPISGWDTLGFRGTCSSGFEVTACGRAEQILPVPFAEILAQTMHPYAHVVWASLWAGIAADAVNRARAFVRTEARKTPGEVPLSALRLAEVDAQLQQMRQNIAGHAREYLDLLQRGDPDALAGFGFAIRTNNLKVSSAQQVVEIVGAAMLVCGISGYRNDSKFSLARHLRDAYGAALMVNNDRILKLNAAMLLAHREG
ncbi:MAG: acyl-CoA dehydrogenase family protein [Gemmataceae bacterium]